MSTITGQKPRLPLGPIALLAIAAGATAGFGVFKTWPSLLATVPNAMTVYPYAFDFFSRGQIVIAFAVIAVALTRAIGARWLPAFVAVYLLSLGSELAGTTVGLPFGPYHYTGALGGKWFGHVPYLIPVSWFMMAVPSYVLADDGSGSRGARRIIIAALILLAWDLVLDPAMSGATAFWVWGTKGPYYGMPWLNLFGWFVTGLVLMGALSVCRADRWAASLDTRWMLAYYAANLALPIGMAAVSGMWGAIVTTLVTLGICAAFVRLRLAPSRALA